MFNKKMLILVSILTLFSLFCFTVNAEVLNAVTNPSAVNTVILKDTEATSGDSCDDSCTFDYTHLDGEKHMKTCTNADHKNQSKKDHEKTQIANYDHQGHSYFCNLCEGNTKFYDHDIEYEGNQYNQDGHAKKCKICPFLIPEDHDISEEVFFDDDHHYKKCIKCDVKIGKTEHVLSNNYTHDDTHHHKYCIGCDYYESWAHTSEITDYDESEHTLTCTICGHEYSKAHNIVYGESTFEHHIKKCTDCPYTIYENHWRRFYHRGLDGHIMICTLCNYNSGTIPHVPKEDNPFECRDCNYELCIHDDTTCLHIDPIPPGHYARCNNCQKEFLQDHHLISIPNYTTHCSICNYGKQYTGGGGNGGGPGTEW